MLDRYEKRNKENWDAASELMPLILVVTSLAYFSYRKLKKQYMSDPDVHRIETLEAEIPTIVLMTLAILFACGGLYPLFRWLWAAHPALIWLWPGAVVAAWAVTKRALLLLAARLLGVVVNPTAGTLSFPGLIPAVITVPLREIGQITRQDGSKLHIAGPFGSHTLAFQDKRRRDECLYVLRTSTKARMPAEFE